MSTVANLSTPPIWQQSLAKAFRNVADLLAYLDINIDDLSEYQQAHGLFPLLVTQHYADLIRKGDLNDPLLRQVLPSPDELNVVNGYLSDPVGDMKASVSPGLLHKYHGRALMITTGACAIHCRYCFRREFPYSNNSTQRSFIQSTIDYLESNDEVNEVILSGGDPLTLSDQRLRELIENIANIKHIQRLRIHSRLPIVLPKRITDELLDLLANNRLQVIMVVHANHPNEISGDVKKAFHKMQTSGIRLLNQTVLLKGINDDSNTLADLSNVLFDHHVLPYYLHTLDKVNGAAHFDIPLEQALALHKTLQQSLSGYLVPKLVREIEGEKSKTLLITK